MATAGEAGRRRRAWFILIAVAVVGLFVLANGSGSTPTVEPLLRANWVGAFDHDPDTGQFHAIVDQRASARDPAQRRLVTHDMASGTTTVHLEDFDMPTNAWVGIARDGAVWAHGSSIATREPFVWHLDDAGTLTSVPVVRVAEVGCDLFATGDVTELGVWLDDGVLRPLLLLVDQPDGERLAVAAHDEVRHGVPCDPVMRTLTTHADLADNLQHLAADGWLATAAADADTRWHDPSNDLEIREVSAGLIRQLTGNNPCERVRDRVRWDGLVVDFEPCRGITQLPTSGHVVTDDGLIVTLGLRGIGLVVP